MIDKKIERIQFNLEKNNKKLKNMNPKEIITWGYDNFDSHFAITTSFGIQSSVLLDIVCKCSLQKKIKIFWIDTGYLPSETYKYAERLINDLSLDIEVLQSELSPARMESLHGKLWETNKSNDLDKYHEIRKIKPLENALDQHNIYCWASGVRSEQTDNRKRMNFLDQIRKRLCLRPLLSWTKKDIFYYMKENELPYHPLFLKGYSTVGDWHSSSPDNIKNEGRSTRFSGMKQECGIHTEN